MPYVKLDTGILQSTLWFERDARELFITALLMAEPYEITESTIQFKVDAIEPTGFEVPPGWYGFVRAAGIGIIRQAGMEREPGMKALKALGDPDIESRSSDFEGRRLVRVDGGFVVLNFVKYRDRDQTTADRSRRWRQRQKEIRAQQCDGVSQRRDERVRDTPRNYSIKHQAEAEDLTVSKNSTSSSSSQELKFDDDDVGKVLQIYSSNPATRHRVTNKDKIIATELLGKYSVPQIEGGILLASARRNGGKIQSLGYFADAVAEAAADPNMTESYVEYLRRTLAKKWKAPS